MLHKGRKLKLESLKAEDSSKRKTKHYLSSFPLSSYLCFVVLLPVVAAATRHLFTYLLLMVRCLHCITLPPILCTAFAYIFSNSNRCGWLVSLMMVTASADLWWLVQCDWHLRAFILLSLPYYYNLC